MMDLCSRTGVVKGAKVLEYHQFEEIGILAY